MEGETEERDYKVLVVGEGGCGKTSYINQYVNHIFSKAYKATVGVDFALKQVQWENTRVRLALWDIAGQERFNHMTRVYYKGAHGAMVVFDVTKDKTFQAVPRWKKDIDSNLDNIPTVLVANKCDLLDNPLDTETMEKFCAQHGFIGWYETSAKENIRVEDCGTFLLEHLVKRDRELNPGKYTNTEKTVSLTQASDPRLAAKTCNNSC
ncbi:ras-related protein Rab-32-like [Planoprotostelium fungivorum]|uniref:Ras-related protein Rab n=1 Tax=Planoprotostelium fungivorum TaxID=1890364 RepID=A0A2P6N882_9EUKA|nr:ras-related protein Rab-32-like [Planoprotostelium fungivorum]